MSIYILIKNVENKIKMLEHELRELSPFFLSIAQHAHTRVHTQATTAARTHIHHTLMDALEAELRQ